MLRIPITPERLAEKLSTLQNIFPASNDFYVIMAEHVLKQQLTVRETDWVVNCLIENHRGALFVADVMELCKTVKRNRLPDEYLVRMQQKELSASDERKGGKF